MGRFINADEIDYLGEDGTFFSYNIFTYCRNNPVICYDPTGRIADTVLDIFFICLDINSLCTDEGYKEWENWAALGVDIVFAVFPFVTGGGGQIVKLANVADDISDFDKVTVIGESMNRVETISQFVNATDNLYEGFKSYDKLSKMGEGGKVLAEVGGKASNVAWLYGKLRVGYQVIDIGIDTTRTVRSSSYIAEKITVKIWEIRNSVKLIYHIKHGEAICCEK